jgi:hypothetical protein
MRKEVLSIPVNMQSEDFRDLVLDKPESSDSKLASRRSLKYSASSELSQQ